MAEEKLHVPKELQVALRQYRHNNSDEFVVGYDIHEINKAFAVLESKLRQALK